MKLIVVEEGTRWRTKNYWIVRDDLGFGLHELREYRSRRQGRHLGLGRLIEMFEGLAEATAEAMRLEAVRTRVKDAPARPVKTFGQRGESRGAV